MKLTVAKKMIILTSFVLVGLAALAGSSYFQLQKVFTEASYASNNTVPTYMQFIQIKGTLADLRANTLLHVITTDAAKMTELEANIAKIVTNLNTTVGAYAKDACAGSSCISDDKEQKMYEEVVENVKLVLASREQVMFFSKQNKTQEAELAVKNELFPAFTNLSNAIQTELDYNIVLANAGREQAIQTQQSANQISVIITLLVSLAIAAFCWFFTRSLLKQLGGEPEALAQLAEDFAKGEIKQKVTVAETDKTSIAYNIKTLQTTLNGLVQSLGYVTQQHDLGEIDVTVDASRFKGAYADMANGINQMVAGHIQLTQKALTCVKSFGEGNLSAQLETFPGKKAFVNTAIEQVRNNINALVNDVNTLSDAAVAGKLSVRADASRHQGDFRKIVEGVNHTLDAVITPLNTAASYVDSIAKGHIPAKISEDYKGDFNALKNNLNQCIDAVNNLVIDANTLAQGAAQGQLSTRADASRHQGDFRKIIEGVNNTLDAVVGPLNTAADCVERISKGDIPEPITAHYNGDFNALKNNLNTCIAAVNRLVVDANMLAEAAADGRITERADTSAHQGDFRKVVEGVNATLETIVAPIAAVKEAVETITTAAGEISSGNADLSSRTEQQASSLEETASSMEELASTVKQNAENAKQANQLAAAASSVAIKGGVAVGQVVSTMSSINESAKKIEDIISVIDGIAFQTNILALNAAVEAARAGEQGRGFAVVAGEVRNLAQRSAGAAKEIKELITDSVNKTAEGTQQVEAAGATMQEIVSSVQRVTDIMGEIAAASSEQSAGIDQVNNAITSMDETTQQNAALVEEAAAAAESLVEQANQLSDVVSQFKVGNASAPVQRRASSSPMRASKPTKAASTPKPQVSAPMASTASARTGTNDSEWEEF